MKCSADIELSDSIKQQLVDGYKKEESEMSKKYKYVCLDCGQDVDKGAHFCYCGISFLSTTPNPKPRTKRVEIKGCEYCGRNTCTCGATE